jgi:hypothetical protein
MEQTFKDSKEVWGAGQQRVRNLHANVGAFNLVYLHAGRRQAGAARERAGGEDAVAVVPAGWVVPSLKRRWRAV